MNDSFPFDVESTRSDFPILASTVHGKPLTYLDSAATSQKPQSVVSAIERYYALENANIHRGLHHLSEKATDAYESTRAQVADFIGVSDPDTIIFTRGATEGINIVAHGFVESVLQKGDEILISHMEHHANIVPWQIACEKTGAILKVSPVNDDGSLDLAAMEQLINDRTKLLAIVHVSNSLGTVNPVESIIKIAHANAVPVLLDGSQSVPHQTVDINSIGCDFFVFSGHKILGPTGIGVLWAKRDWLERFPPYQSGGDMIETVDFDGTSYKQIPGKFEAGTPHIAGVIGLSAALKYLKNMDRIGAYRHEQELLTLATEQLKDIDGLRIIGTALPKASVISFVFDGIHAHDVGTFLDADAIAIRSGHHCTQPLLKRFCIPATARASFAFYNNNDDVNRLVISIKKLKKYFS
ncbi:MAG: cysteine desulfurase [Puniceicoccaceae bacterium]|nr:cysteine desulfurase [Puniceicoccaceae bacterium]